MATEVMTVAGRSVAPRNAASLKKSSTTSDALAVVLEELLGRGIDADAREPRHRVGVQQRAVVAPDVEHGVAAAQTGERLQGVDLALQVSDHALVQTRAIAVVVAVHLAGFERIGKLQQGALAAPQELEGARADLARGREREDAGEGLLAEVEHGDELRRLAQAAGRDPG